MPITRLDAVLTLALVITVGGFCSLRAQTPEVTDRPSTATPKPTGLISAPKKDETEKNASTAVDGESTTLDAKSKRSTDHSNMPGLSTTSVRNFPVRTSRTPVPPSPQGGSSDDWQFGITPYLWIVSISGRAGIGNLVIDTDQSVTDSNVEINFGFMSTFDARKNRFVLVTDLQYSDLSTERASLAPLFSGTRGSFKTFVLDPEVGYRLSGNEKAFLDVLGGIRYWHVKGELEFSPGVLPGVSVSRSRDWVDGVGGIRARVALSEHWFITGKADLGGGGSKFTYQLFGGVGVKLGDHFALFGGYRDLNVNYDKNDFLFDMSLHGPIVGVAIRF